VVDQSHVRQQAAHSRPQRLLGRPTYVPASGLTSGDKSEDFGVHRISGDCHAAGSDTTHGLQHPQQTQL
jgi:hypothetical protein